MCEFYHINLLQNNDAHDDDDDDDDIITLHFLLYWVVKSYGCWGLWHGRYPPVCMLFFNS